MLVARRAYGGRRVDYRCTSGFHWYEPDTMSKRRSFECDDVEGGGWPLQLRAFYASNVIENIPRVILHEREVFEDLAEGAHRTAFPPRQSKTLPVPFLASFGAA
ncbi:hypothetical protein K523DRAFT_422349 [Schizophyllum commune Tattone D]|nr:hypothetical protein K523DRAFT_422349 [Schizophyllum commune Tattone D]